MAPWAHDHSAHLSPTSTACSCARPAPTTHADLIRLAALDGARPLPGPALVAEENGAIVAALCLSTGRAVADPFVPSLHLVELLRRHAARRHVAGRRAARPPAAAPSRAPGGRALIGAKRSR